MLGCSVGKCSAFPTTEGAKTGQLTGICAAEGYRGVSEMRAMGGQCRAATPFRPCPPARHPDSRSKRAKSFFFPLNSLLGLWEPALGTVRALLLPIQAASTQFNSSPILGSNWSCAGRRHHSKIPRVCFLFLCYFCNTADAVCHLQVKEPWPCYQWDVFLV